VDREHPVEQRDLEDAPDVRVGAHDAHPAARGPEALDRPEQDAQGHRVDEACLGEVDDEARRAAVEYRGDRGAQLRRGVQVGLTMHGDDGDRPILPDRLHHECGGFGVAHVSLIAAPECRPTRLARNRKPPTGSS